MLHHRGRGGRVISREWRGARKPQFPPTIVTASHKYFCLVEIEMILSSFLSLSLSLAIFIAFLISSGRRKRIPRVDHKPGRDAMSAVVEGKTRGRNARILSTAFFAKSGKRGKLQTSRSRQRVNVCSRAVSANRLDSIVPKGPAHLRTFPCDTHIISSCRRHRQHRLAYRRQTFDNFQARVRAKSRVN